MVLVKKNGGEPHGSVQAELCTAEPHGGSSSCLSLRRRERHGQRRTPTKSLVRYPIVRTNAHAVSRCQWIPLTCQAVRHELRLIRWTAQARL